MTKEYTDLYGDVVNALMAFKQQFNKIVDDNVAELNLPTRKEIDSLHERAHALRRDNIVLKKEIEALKKAVFRKAGSPVADSSPDPIPAKAKGKPVKKTKAAKPAKKKGRK
jgi:hypothetical protein